jgi:hypothetical protein
MSKVIPDPGNINVNGLLVLHCPKMDLSDTFVLKEIKLAMKCRSYPLLDV